MEIDVGHKVKIKKTGETGEVISIRGFGSVKQFTLIENPYEILIAGEENPKRFELDEIETC